MLKQIIITVFLLFPVFSFANNLNLPKVNNTKKFEFKKDYYETEKKINNGLSKLNLGFLWTSKGLLYLYDYKFKDGLIEADPKKAEFCFKKAYQLNDILANYLLPISLANQKKYNEALIVLKKRIDTLLIYDNWSKNIQKEYIRLTNLYASIVLGSKLKANYIQQAITYSFPVADQFNDSLAQLQVGLLYRYLQKKDVSNHFIIKACKNANKTIFVSEYCNKNIEIMHKKKCVECEMKKKLGLI